MHFDEKHTHRWAWAFRRAHELLETGLASANAPERQRLMGLVAHGDLEKEDPEEILPGVIMWLPYYRAVQGEMETRYRCIRENYDGEVDQDAVNAGALKLHEMFMADVRDLAEKYGFLNFADIQALSPSGGVDGFRMPETWIEDYQTMRQAALDALEARDFSIPQLQEWMRYALRGLITYNYWLGRQAMLAQQIYQTAGKDGLQAVIDNSKEDFGWMVSRVFFYDTFQQVGLEGAELYRLGRFAMFCDQVMVTTDREKGADVLKARATTIQNCELYQAIKTASGMTGFPEDLIGVVVCDYCENHGQKNSAIFTPPDQHPDYRRIESFGYGDARCLFYNDFTEGDDDEFDRFMEAQEIVFGEDEYEL
jgi:hypothetical protein